MELIETAEERGDIGEFNPGAKLYRLEEAIATEEGNQWGYAAFVPGEGIFHCGIGVFATDEGVEESELLFEAPDERGAYLILMDRYLYPDTEPVWSNSEGDS